MFLNSLHYNKSYTDSYYKIGLQIQDIELKQILILNQKNGSQQEVFGCSDWRYSIISY